MRRFDWARINGMTLSWRIEGIRWKEQKENSSDRFMRILQGFAMAETPLLWTTAIVLLLVWVLGISLGWDRSVI